MATVRLRLIDKLATELRYNALRGIKPEGDDVMLKLSERQNIAISSRKDRDCEIVPKNSFYSDCYTLEPDLVDDAWDRLNRDTFTVEIAAYPLHLHNAFIRALKKRAKHA